MLYLNLSPLNLKTFEIGGGGVDTEHLESKSNK